MTDWEELPMPAHLREDALEGQCNRCLRKTVASGEWDTECRMTQPDGNPCGGWIADPIGPSPVYFRGHELSDMVYAVEYLLCKERPGSPAAIRLERLEAKLRASYKA